MVPSILLASCSRRQYTTAVLLLVFVLSFSSKIVSGYHLGGNDTNCWKGPKYAQLFIDCDHVAEINFLITPPADVPLYVDEPFTLVAELKSARPLIRRQGVLVTHANYHMCRAELGWCTPNVAVTPELVTQSPPIAGDSLVLKVTDLVVSIPGHWSIVAHFSILNDEGEWEVAAGIKRRFLKKKTPMEVSPWAITLVTVLASVGLGVSALTGLFVFLARNHWVLKATSPNLSLIVIFGCAVAFASVFTLLPPELKFDSPADVNEPVPTTPSVQCNSRIWVLSLAFDFVLIPLALKTWRVSVLFSGTFQRVNITDATLSRFAAVLLLLDIAFCLAWSLGFPLYVAMIPTVSNPESVYIVQCTGNHQITFELVTIIVLHGLPLIWLAWISRKVKYSFQKRRLAGSASVTSAAATCSDFPQGGSSSLIGETAAERRLRQFNESDSLGLTLTMLACVSIFAIALQYTVTDSPTAQMLMVSGGVIWSAFFILSVLFLPRLIKYVKYEKDGVTKRSTTRSGSLSSLPQNGSILIRRDSLCKGSPIALDGTCRESAEMGTPSQCGITSPSSASSRFSEKPVRKSVLFHDWPGGTVQTSSEEIKADPPAVPEEQIPTESSTPMSSPSPTQTANRPVDVAIV